MKIVWDLDKTLAADTHRASLLDGIRDVPEEKQGPIWQAYFEQCTKDAPIMPMLNVFKALRAAGHRCEIWTGRPKRFELQTRTWLTMHGIALNADELLMRDNDDFRPDYVMKGEWLDKAIANKAPVDLAFDDRDQMVKMWRERGVQCCQVAYGSY